MNKDALTGVVLSLAMLAVILFGVSRWGDHREAIGRAKCEAESTAVAKAADSTNRAKEAALKIQVEMAVRNAEERQRTFQADASRARAESERLRGDLKVSRSQLSRASADAVREYAATLGDVFSECSAEVEEVARKATGHAIDSLMLQEAWAK